VNRDNQGERSYLRDMEEKMIYKYRQNEGHNEYQSNNLETGTSSFIDMFDRRLVTYSQMEYGDSQSSDSIPFLENRQSISMTQTNESNYLPPMDFIESNSSEGNVEKITITEDKSNQTKKRKRQYIKETNEESHGESYYEEKVKRRRESQIKASRLYRQRKKDQIKDMERKMQELTVENSKLRNRNKLLESQVSLNVPPSPLFRSYSEEYRLTDKDIENVVKELNDEITITNNDEKLNMLLKKFHLLMKKRQDILSKEVQQFAHPRLQERLIRLSGLSQQPLSCECENKLIYWLDNNSNDVTVEQKKSIKYITSSAFNVASTNI